MKRCPNCGLALPSDATPKNHCDACGASWDGEEPGTPAYAPTTDGDLATATPLIAPTIDSDDSSTAPAEAGPRHLPARSLENLPRTPFDPTLDSDVPPSAQDDRIASLWGKSLAGTSPTASIRASDDTGSRSRTGQTIHERAIGKANDPQAPGADYQILGLLGEGGMGVVYSARQASIDRDVAVKMLKPNVMANARQREKFLSEAVVTGELEHPGIVPIYDMGTSGDGSLFYSMKKIHGTPWSQVLRKKSLPENLEILLKVADAIAFAHSREVIHRDLKPENVMLGEFGEVLVVDWGLAVSIAADPKSSSVARVTSMGGTPAYMAPEMAFGPFEKIGKSSDIYLLGAMLFESVTGKMPHYGKSSSECLAAAGRNEIVATDKTGELIDIARTAMATKPEDRFESVHAFQAAIREYQSHTESVALTSRAAAELEKAVGNDDYRDYNRALFGFEEAWELWPKNAQAGVGIGKARLAYAQSAQRKGDFDLGISLLIGDDASQRELRDQLRAAQRERDARSHRLRTARRVVLGLAALVFLAVTAGIVLVSLQKAEADRLRVVAEDNEVEAKHQAGLARDNEAEAKHQAGLARDNAKEALRQKDVADQQRKNTEYEAYIALVGLAAAKIEENAFDRAVELLKLCQPERRNWEWGRLMYLCQQGTKQFAVRNRVECVALDPDAKTLVTGSRDGIARSWSIESGKLIAEHKLDAPGSYVACVAVSPIQRDWVAVGGNAPGAWLRLWNMKTGQVRILDSHQATVASVVFSRDGKRLLTGSFDNTAMLWDVASGKMVRTFRGHDWHVWQAAFSPDEKTVVTASRDGTARLWNAATGEQRTTSTGEKMPFMGHRGAVYSAAFSPDGALVATCGYDKRVLLWKPSELMAFDFQKLLSGDDVPAQKFVVLEGHTAAVRAVAFSRDGRHLLSASHDNSIKIWRIGSAAKSGDGLEPATLVKTLRGHHSLVCSAAFFPQDDNFVVSGSHDGFARVWNIKNYQEQRVIPGLALQGHTDGVLTARFSQRGEFVLTASRDRTAKAWQTDTGDEVQTYREGHAFLATRAVFFRDGKALLTAGMDGTLRVWDIDTGAERLAIHGAGHAAAAAISSDGKQILGGLAADPLTPADPTAENLPRAALWDAEKGTVIQTFARHKTDVTVTVFSSDARLVFTGDANGRGNLWDGKTGRHLAQLAWHTARISAAAFRSGDRRLLTASADGTVCPWDIADPARPHPLESGVLKHGAAVTAMAAGDDGTSILTGCDDGVVRWWKLDQPDRPRIVPLPTRVRASSVALAAGGRQALVVDPERHIVWLAELARAAEASFEVHQFLDSAAQGAGAWSAEFSPDNQAIVTVGGDEARLWDLQSREIMQFTPHRSVAAANYSPDATRVVTAGWDNSARIWDARSGKTIIKLAGKLAGELGSHTAPINSAVFSPDGNQVLTASDDRNIKLWDAKSGRVVRNFTGHAASVKSAVFSSDGRRIVSASADRTARIWDVSSGRSLRELKGHNLPVLSAIYSADDRWVITGGEDNVALVWNSDDGAQLLTLKGHTAAVTSVAVLADRTRVLTGSADQTAKLWDSANGKEVLTLKGHARDVTSVSFSQDQSKALTASRDGTAAVWLTAPWRVLETKGINNNNN